MSNLEKQIQHERAKVFRLKLALKQIIEECPNPKLPYGKSVNDIAKQALEIDRN